MMPAFTAEKRGYNKQEVDTYIDFIRAEYDKARDLCEQLAERNQTLTQRVQTLEKSAADQQDVARAMITAQKAARDTELTAREQAAELLKAAQRQAEDILREAQTNANAKTAEADEKSRQILTRFNIERQEIYAELQKIHNRLQPLMEGGERVDRQPEPPAENIGTARQGISGNSQIVYLARADKAAAGG
jgi:cell division initiation protein